MKRFAAQLVFTNSGPPLRRGIITTDDDGKIVNVEDTGGMLTESRSVEFYNGIIIPGFVNCHCHLELSFLKDTVPQSEGLGDFIMHIRNLRGGFPLEKITEAASSGDDEMYREGIVLCADTCNSSDTFSIKNSSRIGYLNLLEVFGIDPGKAWKRMAEGIALTVESERNGLEWQLVPHSVYSVSLSLFRLLKEKSGKNLVTSIHFMETPVESEFLSEYSGSLKTSYEASGLMPEKLEMAENHVSAIMNEVTQSGNLILVHNTSADALTIRKILKRRNIYWCLCPGSNLYIEGKLPPVEMLRKERCEIIVGTDSLASNKKLSILEELKLLQEHFPSVSLEELITWGTINGARALGKEDIFGIIEPDKRPGLILLENIDLVNLRLISQSTARRLI